MNILITGAAGQIGSSLAKRLIAANHNCYLLDLPNTLFRSQLREAKDIWDIDLSKENHDCRIEWHYSYKNPLDCIIHLAAITSLPECEANPVRAFNTNVGGTANILDFARKAGVPHVIFASTSAVYENNKERVFTEDLAVNPKLVYSQSKKMAEDMIDSYRDHYGMCITTLRLFNVFGPDGDSKRLHPPLLNHLVREFKKSGKAILSGDGTQARDFIHIDDVLRAINGCLQIWPNDTFNVCSGELTSVRDFAAAVASGLEECGMKDLKIEYKPANQLWDAYPALFSGSFPLKRGVVSFEANKRSLGSYEKIQKKLDWIPYPDTVAKIKESAIECFHKI